MTRAEKALVIASIEMRVKEESRAAKEVEDIG